MCENYSSWSNDESATVIERYENRLREYGYSEEALGWGKKGRQQLRFSILASHWEMDGKSILDLGAGFGDFYAFAKKFRPQKYCGIDITPGLVDVGIKKYGGNQNFELICGSVTDETNIRECDIAIISGLFNFRLNSGKNRLFIEEVLRLAFKKARIGVACNFVTDHVEFRDPLIHYQSPTEILEFALGLTRNVTFVQNYMPFEFTIFIDKREHFDLRSAVFSHLDFNQQ